MKHLHIVIPGMTPPSVNMYTRHGGGRHYKTPEAKGFLNAVVLFARSAEQGQGELPKKKDTRYEVMLVAYHGKGERGDIDNRAKIPLDGLVDAGVIPGDAAIVDLDLRKRTDWNNPRTEIWVRVADPEENPRW